MKIVFFGTANVALPILEELKKQHEILAVVTTPDAEFGRKREMQESPVSSLAKDLKLPLFKPEKVKGNAEFYSQLKNLGADIFVVVAYGKILPLEIINLPKYKTINVHFSLLPKYRGPSPIQTALLNGDAETGTSIFILDEKVDDGPLLYQEKVAIDSWENYFILADKLAKVSAKKINSIITDYISDKIVPTPQNNDLVSFTKMISKEDGKIDWSKTANEIYNQFRAFYPWPGIWTNWNSQKLKITECLPTELQIIRQLADGSADNKGLITPGKILENGIVACGGNTYLKINQLQLAGKNEASIAEFLNGYQNFVGGLLS